MTRRQRTDLASKIDGEAPIAIESEILLPVQFFPAGNGWRTVEGEMRLIFTLMVDAIQCFQRPARNEEARREAAEASAWIFTDDHSWPFSFASICAVLSIDCDLLRQALRRWKHQADCGAARPAFKRSQILSCRQHRVAVPRQRTRRKHRTSA